MHVLHVTRQFHPCIGGVERLILESSKRLVDRGIDCSVLTINRNLFAPGKFSSFEDLDGIKIYRVGAFGLQRKPIPLVNPFRVLNLYSKIDIIHIHDVRFLFETSLVAKMIWGKPIILSTCGFIFHTPIYMRFKKFIFRHYFLRTFKYIDKIIAISVNDYRFLENTMTQCREKVVTIEGGISYSKFSKVKKRIKPGKLAYFGRIDANKGIDTLFSCLSRINNNYELVVIGRGEEHYLKFLMNYAEELGIQGKIRWTGILSDEEMMAELEDTQYFVFPSRYEGFGLVLIEAMATRTVPIVNDIPVFRSIINQSKNGFMVDFADPVGAAEEITHLLEKEENELIEIGKNAQATAKLHDWDNKVDEIIQVYEKVLKLHRGL